jgi:hypothetical protein
MKKSAVPCFIQISGGQLHDGLRGVFFASGEAVAIQFEKEDPHYKARALVPIHKRMVANNPGRISSGHGNDISRFSIGEVLLRPGQRRFQQAVIAKASGAAVQRQQAIMKNERIALVYPNWVFHLAKPGLSLGQTGSFTWQERAACCGSG